MMGRFQSHQAAESRARDLPTELHALVNYLAADGRPSAIVGLRDTTDIQYPDNKIVYENPAFAGLGFDDRCVGQLLQELGWFGEQERHWEDEFDIQSWKLSDVHGEYHVLSYDTGQQAKASTEFAHRCGVKARKGLSVKTVDEQNDMNGHGSTSPQHDPQDWTRFPVEGLSEWTEYIRTFDWASTGVGSMYEWSDLLRSCVLHIMSHPDARLILWGETRTVIYNAACIELFGAKHPACLGKPVSEPWAEIWDEIQPMIEDSYSGKTLKLERLPLITTRNGFQEESYWDFVSLPIIGSGGHVFGQFVELQEMTKAVVGVRRRDAVIAARKRMETVETLQELWRSYLGALETAREDVPFAMLYEAADKSSRIAAGDLNIEHSPPVANLVGTVGVAQDNVNVKQTLVLSGDENGDLNITEQCVKAWQTGEQVILRREDGTLPDYLAVSISGRGFSDKISTAIVSPITSLGGSDVLALLVIGVNPRRPYDEDYKIFVHFLSDFLIRAASLISLPLEQRRARKIADDMNNELAQQLRLITLRAERKEETFTRMASEAPTGVFVFDTEGHPLYVNEAYLRMLGLTKERHMARGPDAVTWQDHIHPDDLPRFIETWSRATKEKAPFTIEHRLEKPWISVDKASGQEISGETWLLANAFPEIGQDGKITSIQGWLTDISHRKFTDGLVSRKLEEALENKRQTENFIDMTSHEMRNPLSAILQSADNILSTVDAADADHAKTVTLSHDIVHEIHDAAQTIILCAQHQKRIVDDILTLSKLDASLLVISPDKVQPPLLLDKAIRMFEAEISRANITVRMEIEPTYDTLISDDWIVLDPSRLLQVVINLLTNAIKFTQDAEKREITICLGASYDKPTGKHHKVNFIPTKHVRKAESPLDDWGNGEILYLQIAVTDTGRGLTDDDMKVLFQRFSQASPKTYKQYGGSGLGLVRANQSQSSNSTADHFSSSYPASSANSKAAKSAYLAATAELPSLSSSVPNDGYQMRLLKRHHDRVFPDSPAHPQVP